MKAPHAPSAIQFYLTRQPNHVRPISIFALPRPKKCTQVIDNFAGFDIIGVEHAMIAESAMFVAQLTKSVNLQDKNSTVSRYTISKRSGNDIAFRVLVTPVSILNTHPRIADVSAVIWRNVITGLPAMSLYSGWIGLLFFRASTPLNYEVVLRALTQGRGGHYGLDNTRGNGRSHQYSGDSPKSPPAQITDQATQEQKPNNSTHLYLDLLTFFLITLRKFFTHIVMIPIFSGCLSIESPMRRCCGGNRNAHGGGLRAGWQYAARRCDLCTSPLHKEQIRSFVFAELRHIGDVLADVIRNLAEVFTPEPPAQPAPSDDPADTDLASDMGSDRASGPGCARNIAQVFAMRRVALASLPPCRILP